MSAGRKSETTGTPNRAASIEPSPICQVQTTLRPRKPLCLALVIKRLPMAHPRDLPAAAPNSRWVMRMARHTTQLAGSSVATNPLHWRGRCIHRRQDCTAIRLRIGILSMGKIFESGSARVRGSFFSTRSSATSIPSAEVPLITPATIISPARPRRRPHLSCPNHVPRYPWLPRLAGPVLQIPITLVRAGRPSLYLGLTFVPSVSRFFS